MSRDAEIATAGYAAAPLDWYVEPRWVVNAFALAELKHGLLTTSMSYKFGHVWDPCCGRGTIVDYFEYHKIFSLSTTGSDIEYRGCQGPIAHVFDFLEEGVAEDLIAKGMIGGKLPLSIVMNPPFSYKKGIAEAFVRRALTLATVKVAVLVPLKWLSSGVRYTLFTEFPPRTIYVLSERPSMPPGAQVDALGVAAFKRGKMDFVWIVWDVATPTPLGETRTVWIAPRDKAARS